MVMLIFLLFSDQISRGANVSEGGECLRGCPIPLPRETEPVVGIAKNPNHTYCSNYMTSSFLQSIIWPSHLQD